MKEVIKKLLREGLVNEIGEASAKPYNWVKTFDSGKDTEYEFKTNFDLDYIVSISWIKDKDFSVNFDADGYYNTTTNNGDIFNIMSTIVDIVKSFIDSHKNIERIIIRPTKKSDDDKGRENLYLAYIKKQLPNKIIELIDNNIIINF
jgi:hypothetical protein